MKNLSKLIKLLRYLFELDNEKNEKSILSLNNIIEKWSLGRYHVESNDDLNELSIDGIFGNIKIICFDLKENLSSEGLTILYNDLNDIINADGKVSEIELKVLLTIKDIWAEKLIDLSVLLNNSFFDTDIPQNNLLALGYLFYTAVKIDGNIDKLELMQVRRNLESWDNHAARIILESINFYEFVSSKNNFINVFQDKNILSDEEKNKIQKCIIYLKNNESKDIRKIMYEQIMAIVKADSVITNTERWLNSQIREIWNDI